MQRFDIKKYLPYILTIVGFAILAWLYNYPQLQGRVLQQGDVMGWEGMSQEAKAWYEKTGEGVLWTNSMFGGMPTFTFYTPGGHNFMWYIQNLFVAILGKPACFVFLAMLGFYILMRVLRMNNWLAIAGAVAYGFATFNIVSVEVGHETKVFSIAYLPAVLGGMLLIYRSKWWTGIALMGISLALMVTNSHYQILYYTIIIVVCAVIGLAIIAIREKRFRQFMISSAVALVTAMLAAGPNMQSILSTLEYNKETMRGGQSELTFNHDPNKKAGGLDRDYAFSWSNSVGETFCLMIPGLYGGSVREPIESAPQTAELVGGQVEQIPLYWGPQPFVYGPVYFGAIVCFLFVLGLMIVRSPHKWWILAASLIGIFLSLGKNFPAFNFFLFDNLPLYNKFRTPTMALAIPQLLFPLLGIWALNDIVTGAITKEEAWKKTKIAVGITAGICVIFGIGASMFFDFSSAADAGRFEQADLLRAIKEDRASMASKSSFVSAVYILIGAALVWAYLKGKIAAKWMMIGMGLVIAIDLIATDSRYLNEDSYVDAEEYEVNFQPRPVDQQILQDPDPYYRVLDLTRDTYNDAIQSYYHKTIGGHSPAKLELYQDMIDVHLSQQTGKFNSQVVNMLNTKYIIVPGQNNQPAVLPNPEANGNAWFVKDIKWASTADEEILSLNAPALGDTAMPANTFDSKNTAVMRSTFKNDLANYQFGKDSAASIKLAKYGLNEISFTSSNSQNGVAVFADIYYPKGWKAYIDGKETPILKANYLLRALKVPAGQHSIVFKFHPQSFYTGDTIAIISSIILLIVVLVALYKVFREQTPTKA